MIAAAVTHDFASWRDRARDLLARRVPPDQVDWIEHLAGEESLFGMQEDGTAGSPGGETSVRVTTSFLDLARTAWAHPDPRRHGVLYRLLWRLTRGGEKHLMSRPTDPDVHLAEGWRKTVRREIHKMHAFVRFRLTGTDEATGREQYVAWFEPATRCVRLAVPFFEKRFAGMDWSILTPDECAHWNGQQLHFTPGIPRDRAPGGDALDALWRTYYKSIFNPARLKVKAMQSEMPVKYWKNLPESDLIEGLIAGSRTRMEGMIETEGREVRPVPDNAYIQKLHERHEEEFLENVPGALDLAGLSLPELHMAASACRACPLWARATQTVPGQGPSTARVMVVGEQPGDREDLSGSPFVGPAGQVLRHAMTLVGLEAESVYLTNAVKHFKWTPDGRRRKHLSPDREEVQHCRPWILAELAQVKPEVVVLLGGTAALSLLGREVKVTQERGVVDAPRLAPRVILTWHPSYLLRLPPGAARNRAMAEFEADLKLAMETV